MQLPLKERRRLLAEQADKLVEHYEHDEEWRELDGYSQSFAATMPGSSGGNSTRRKGRQLKGTLDLLRECHELVWHFWEDNMLNPQGLAPSNTLDSLRYAVTEIGKAIDAMLRGGDALNDADKDDSVKSALAGCAMMLLTAMGKDGFIDWYQARPGGTLDEICWLVATAMSAKSTGSGSWIFSAQTALDNISVYPELDLKKQLSYRFACLRKQHMAPTRQDVVR
jgi:hypothetical protein